MNEGIIYIARNPEYKEDIYKVGKTERTNLPFNRMLELSNHEGVLGQFKVLGYLLVDDVNESEKKCHNKLNEYRYQNNREFFQINIKILSERLREILSDSIIKDYLPKFNLQKNNEENLTLDKKNKGYENFLFHMSDLLNSLIYNPTNQTKDFSDNISKEMRKISKKYKQIGLIQQDLCGWDTTIETTNNFYNFQILADHKDFIGFDLLDVGSLEIESIKKEYSDHIYLKFYEIIIKGDNDYLKKTENTRSKLNEIYNNDKLYMEYTNNSSKDFANIDNYIFHAFFIKEIREEVIEEFSDADMKKVWKEIVFKPSSKIEPTITYFKGSAERIIAELSSIIENDYPDKLIELPKSEKDKIK